MTTPTLFDTHPTTDGTGRTFGTPKSHRNDPSTSSDAAKRAEQSGATAQHRRMILESLRASPRAMTGKEIAAACGLGQVQVMRRVCELRRAGLITSTTRPGKPEQVHELTTIEG